MRPGRRCSQRDAGRPAINVRIPDLSRVVPVPSRSRSPAPALVGDYDKQTEWLVVSHPPLPDNQVLVAGQRIDYRLASSTNVLYTDSEGLAGRLHPQQLGFELVTTIVGLLRKPAVDARRIATCRISNPLRGNDAPHGTCAMTPVPCAGMEPPAVAPTTGATTHQPAHVRTTARQQAQLDLWSARHRLQRKIPRPGDVPAAGRCLRCRSRMQGCASSRPTLRGGPTEVAALTQSTFRARD